MTTPIATVTNMNDMSPQTFVERLPPFTRAHYANALACVRRPPKTLEEEPLTQTEMRTLKAALVARYKSAEEALKVLRHNEAGKLNYTGPVIGDWRPPAGAQCYSYEFDNMKLFFRPEVPSYCRDGSYSMYMGPRGCQLTDCVDWYSRGIRVTAEGLDGKWADCRVLQMIPGGTDIKIHYTMGQGERRVMPFRLPRLTVEESRRCYLGADKTAEIVDLGAVVRSSGHN